MCTGWRGRGPWPGTPFVVLPVSPCVFRARARGCAPLSAPVVFGVSQGRASVRPASVSLRQRWLSGGGPIPAASSRRGCGCGCGCGVGCWRRGGRERGGGCGCWCGVWCGWPCRAHGRARGATRGCRGVPSHATRGLAGHVCAVMRAGLELQVCMRAHVRACAVVRLYVCLGDVARRCLDAVPMRWTGVCVCKGCDTHRPLLCSVCKATARDKFFVG